MGQGARQMHVHEHEGTPCRRALRVQAAAEDNKASRSMCQLIESRVFVHMALVVSCPSPRQLARPPIVPRVGIAISEVGTRLCHPRAVPQRLADRPVLLVQLARPVIARPVKKTSYYWLTLLQFCIHPITSLIHPPWRRRGGGRCWRPWRGSPPSASAAAMPPAARRPHRQCR